MSDYEQQRVDELMDELRAQLATVTRERDELVEDMARAENSYIDVGLADMRLKDAQRRVIAALERERDAKERKIQRTEAQRSKLLAALKEMNEAAEYWDGDPRVYVHARALATYAEVEADIAAGTASETAPGPTESPVLLREEVEAALKTGRLEAAANAEYRTGTYDPERGGPALRALNEHRHSAPEPTEREDVPLHEQQRHAFALRVAKAALTEVRAKILSTAALPEYSRGIKHCLHLLGHLDYHVIAAKAVGREPVLVPLVEQESRLEAVHDEYRKATEVIHELRQQLALLTAKPTTQATHLQRLPQPGEYNARVKVSIEGAVFNIEVLEFKP